MKKVSNSEAFCYSNVMPKAIIFDFDGTIADSFELFVKTLNKLLRKTEPISQERLTELRGMSIKEIMAQLGIKSWQLPRFIIKGRREIGKNFDDIAVFENMPEVIRTLFGMGYEMYVLSTNNNAVISTFLKKNQLDEYFKQIYANVGLVGKTKSLKKLMRDHRYAEADAIYIGDEVRDIEQAHKAGIKCISVDWGYSTGDSLRANSPDYVVSDARKIVGILDNKSSKLIH